MDTPIVCERQPVIICQCVPACLQPFKDERDEWIGCMRPEGHEPPHSQDGPGAITYRERGELVGPRVVLRPNEAARAGTINVAVVMEGRCHRCGRLYSAMVSTEAHVHTFDREDADEQEWMNAPLGRPV